MRRLLAVASAQTGSPPVAARERQGRQRARTVRHSGDLIVSFAPGSAACFSAFSFSTVARSRSPSALRFSR